MATTQNFQLGTLDREYSRFVRDQVLTEVQLNELIDFFEDQHRLTRTCLFGTGIVCGLRIHSSTRGVTLYPGVAVTTDGDLLRMEEKQFTHAVLYKAPEDCHYAPFFRKDAQGEKQINLYQLITGDEKKELEDSTNADIISVNQLSSVIKDYVTLVYIEYYNRKPEKCTPVNCDNLGMRQVARPIILALSPEDMEYIVEEGGNEQAGDSIYSKFQKASTDWFKLPVIIPRRVLPGKKNTMTSSTLAGAYKSVYSEGSKILCSSITELYRIFSFMIDKTGSSNPEVLTERLHKLLTEDVSIYQAQYVYDFYKDMVGAYNELRDQLYSIAFECIPDLYAFPKHIMLGAPNVPFTPEPTPYRHIFYPSPAITSRNERVNKAIGMWLRLQVMIDSYDTDISGRIKITPSVSGDKPLGQRAIPFYYPDYNKISENWNYERKLMKQRFMNYSYHNPEITEPLKLDIEPYDFYRIEGHIGKEWKSVFGELNELREANGIPVDIVAVRLGDVRGADIDIGNFECHFEDLNLILKSFQIELDCLISDASRFFSGFTPSVEKPHINFSRYFNDTGNQWIIRTAAFSIEPKIRNNISASERILSRPFSEAKRTETPGFFKLNRRVEAGLETSEETFGKYFSKAIEEGISNVGQFVERARTNAATDTGLWNLQEDQRYIVFEYPMQIIGNLAVLQNIIPENILDVKDNLIKDFKVVTNDLCSQIKTIRARAEKYFSGNNKAGYEAKYLEMLEKVSSICCGGEKLEVIRKEIEDRKTAILQKLSLSRYSEDHPGLEHKGGVPRGGTFVMVYAAGTASKKTGVRIREELAERTSGTKEQAEERYRTPERFAVYIAENEGKVNAEEELNNYFKAHGIESGSIYSKAVTRKLNDLIAEIKEIVIREPTMPEKDVVIADFCLPYVNLSACPPVSFIIQNTEKPEQPEEPEPPVDPEEPAEPEEPEHPEDPKEPEPEEPDRWNADKACIRMVVKLIDEKQKLLTTAIIVRTIRIRGLEEMAKQYAEVVDLLNKAKELIASGSESDRIELIHHIGDLLVRIYEYDITDTTKPAAGVGEELIRTLLLLMLNLVRCDKSLGDRELKLLLDNISQFNDRFEMLLKKYNGLDSKNVLEIQIKEFMEGFISNESKLRKVLELTLKLLSKFPE